ncbi:hypothetical protein TVAG_300670 [Trichomonas vaginalis G3]|uniref:Uncharacterized protein n=1 Tax=Trichomonas vaginalis (strain ATCC PRA-98 / G3) TaxID=412133 RepID=A2EP47_TRIV3|nr:nuclear chaperone required for maturation and nuclear export of pre-60s ribosome subunits [Trichomonas vaginalis G3]EAY05585.1 hypothetical protein TVAG_300670 [Trichomonas vaginalis G3]KAI5547511.1 nuclear chaperone required for maturation and nuclear export of pre-60s ribosome subunits [Trichomonas vaginalis G3]|eukprot:XP_001317808.1 hypothetical protein [Trichomonas vaginalis G3]
MPETNLKDLLNKLEEFFGKNAINIINSKIKNFVRKEDREQSIKEFIVKQMQEKFDKLTKDDFQLTYDDQFNINDVNSKRNIKFDLNKVYTQKAKNSEQLEQNIPKFASSESTTIVTEFKADSLHKLTFDTRIISPDERKVISESINTKFEEANEPMLKLDMVPNDEEFDEEGIAFGALTSAKAIYEKISEILSRCRKFVLIMSNYKDYTKGFPNSQAEIQFKNLAAFYAWSSNESTLKTTPFLSQCIEFNNSFISLFKILNKSGCKIQNLKINEKDLKNSDLIQSIMKPKQPLLSVEQFKKDWVMVSRKPLNLNIPLPNPPDNKKKPNPQENKNNGTIVTEIPRKEFTNQIGLNSQHGRG